jgi:radical SAM protein with 4Fe4S-binding SPASM domain
MLNEDKKKATIVFVGFEDTMTEENIDGLFRIAKENNAILRLNVYRPVSQSDEINKKFILSYQTLIERLKYINEKYSIIGLSDILFGSLFTDQNDITENTGVDSIRILPDGSICPSTYLITDDYKSKYNIHQEQVLKGIRFEDFEMPPLPKECEKCSLKNKCRGGVYDRRILWYGTLKERDPYCPFRNSDELPSEKFKVLKQGRISVHDGYLPTMFFKN